MNAVVLLTVGTLLLSLYALCLVLLRAPVFGTAVYRPMIINIGLSLTPTAILIAVLGAMIGITLLAPSAVALWAVIAVGAAGWLLMLPNSAYLITELNFSHRDESERVPLWYDIVLVLTLALSVVFNTLLNLALAQSLYVLVVRPNDDHPLRHPDSWVMSVVVLVLVTFGMYLGRYIRFNSWDIRHPISFVRKLVGYFAERGHVREALGFCTAHSVLLAILYLIVVAPLVAVL